MCFAYSGCDPTTPVGASGGFISNVNFSTATFPSLTGSVAGTTVCDIATAGVAAPLVPGLTTGSGNTASSFFSKRIMGEWISICDGVNLINGASGTGAVTFASTIGSTVGHNAGIRLILNPVFTSLPGFYLGTSSTTQVGPGGISVSGPQTHGLSTSFTNANTPSGGVNYSNPLAGTVSVTSNGSVTITAGITPEIQLSLSANVTACTLINLGAPQGTILTLTHIQDVTGGRTYTYPSNCKFAGGSAPSDTTASKRTSVTFVYDGTTNWNEESRAVAVG